MANQNFGFRVTVKNWPKYDRRRTGLVRLETTVFGPNKYITPIIRGAPRRVFGSTIANDPRVSKLSMHFRSVRTFCVLG